MRFAVLASGSNANCTFIECNNTRLLIDCGLSCKHLEQRLAELKVDPSSIDAILISHEHSDHVRGLPLFAGKYQLPIFTSEKTVKLLPKLERLNFITDGYFQFKDVLVNVVSVPHDAIDPKAFVLSDGLNTLAHVTDLGCITRELKEVLRGVNALILESNYDDALLASCNYHASLKARISSNTGHLSNAAAVAFVSEIFHADLYVLVLAHLSINANHPTQALTCFKTNLMGKINHAHPAFELHCAPRYQTTKLFDLSKAFELKIAAGV